MEISEAATDSGITALSMSYLSNNKQDKERRSLSANFDGSLLVNITAFGCRVSLMVDDTGLVKLALYTSNIGSTIGGNLPQTPRTYAATLGGHGDIVDSQGVDWMLGNCGTRRF